jgi:hypothetical protein
MTSKHYSAAHVLVSTRGSSIMLQTLKVHYTHDSQYTKKHNIISKQNNEMPFLGSRLVIPTGGCIANISNHQCTVTSKMCQQINISWNHRCGNGTRAICSAGCRQCGQGILLEFPSVTLERLTTTCPCTTLTMPFCLHRLRLIKVHTSTTLRWNKISTRFRWYWDPGFVQATLIAQRFVLTEMPPLLGLCGTVHCLAAM